MKKYKLIVVLTVGVLVLCLGFLAVNESRKRTLQVSLAQFDEMTVTLPYGFHAEKDVISGTGEILSLYNFYGSTEADNGHGEKKIAVNGFIKTAVLTMPLYDYLERAEEYKSAAIYQLERTTVIADGIQGYQWQYRIKKPDGSIIIAKDAFFSSDNKFYTLHFAAPSLNKSNADNDLVKGAVDAVYTETLNSIIFSDSVQSGKLLEAYTLGS